MLNRILDCYFDRQMDFYNKELSWICPQCNTKLIRSEDREYETLDDHVSNPNQDFFIIRPTWKCPNSKCINNNTKEHFFGIDGGRYGGTYDEPYAAIYSFDWLMEKRRKFEQTWWYRFFCFFDIKARIDIYLWKIKHNRKWGKK